MKKGHYKYYIVFTGSEVGVFERWADCAASVNAFPHNRYGGIGSLREAYEYAKESMPEIGPFYIKIRYFHEVFHTRDEFLSHLLFLIEERE